MAGVPSHGPWCETRAFRAPCQYCDSSVFHFRCSCGSYVVFDSLGAPWPHHDCKHLPFQKRLEIVADKGLTEAAERWLGQQMMARTIGVDEYRPRRAKDTGQPLAPREIVRMIPYDGLTADETGLVRELTHDVDVYARLGFPKTPVAAAILGELGKSVYAQLTVHTAALGETDDYSYTFFVESRHLTNKRVRKGVLVQVQLRGVDVHSADSVWVCDHVVVM